MDADGPKISLVVGKVIVSVMLVEPGMASPGYQHLAAV